MVELLGAIAILGMIAAFGSVKVVSVMTQHDELELTTTLAAVDLQARATIAANAGDVPGTAAALVSSWKLPAGLIASAGSAPSSGPSSVAVDVSGEVVTMALLSSPANVTGTYTCALMRDDLSIPDVNDNTVRRPQFGVVEDLVDATKCAPAAAGLLAAETSTQADSPAMIAASKL